MIGDTKPFTEPESYFTDSKFYSDEESVIEVLPVKVPLTWKATMVTRKEVEAKGNGNEESHKSPSQIVTSDKLSPIVPILRYVPKSKRKEGEPPF